MTSELMGWMPVLVMLGIVIVLAFRQPPNSGGQA